MQEKVYIVTKNGVKKVTRPTIWGEEIFLLGIFTDKDTAKKVAEEHNAKITEIEPNKVFPLRHNDFCGYVDGCYVDDSCDCNDYHLGGYTQDVRWLYHR